MKSKLLQRLRRARKTRARIQGQGTPMLTVHRTAKHIYAQVIVYNNRQANVVASASTLNKDLRDEKAKKSDSAFAVGKAVAERALQAGVSKVAFDRSGYKYHGRVKAVAEGAREGGINF